MANSQLSTHYNFIKPNDTRALNLMNAAACHVLSLLPDITIAYGVSDEYSFVFHKSTTLFERRNAKLVTTVVSTFTAAYCFFWDQYFCVDDRDGELPKGQRRLDLKYLPTFDGRAVCYPSLTNLRDYLKWRQVDCHINNLYNTTFHSLVQQGGLSNTEAEEHLKGTLAADKNEILFSRFGINYNNEPEMFRKGSVVYRAYALEDGRMNVSSDKTIEDEDDMPTVDNIHELSRTQQEKIRKARQKARIVVEHVDIIKDEFWNRRPWIISGKPGKVVQVEQ